jgi:hypothetical protein
MYYIDKNGKRRPILTDADSHMTVDFMNNYMNEYCRGHIYTVDDDWGVPQRLMLIVCAWPSP